MSVMARQCVVSIWPAENGFSGTSTGRGETVVVLFLESPPAPVTVMGRLVMRGAKKSHSLCWLLAAGWLAGYLFVCLTVCLSLPV